MCLCVYIRILFVNRKDSIFRRIEEIEKFTTNEIFAEVENVYRANYKRTCRGLSWTFPLKLLQLVAACMGGSGLAIVCKALSVSYRHFSAGAPDLLMIRVRKRGSSPVEYVGLDTILGAGWDKLGAVREDLKEEEETDWNSLSIGAPKRTFSQYQGSNNSTTTTTTVASTTVASTTGIYTRYVRIYICTCSIG